MAASCRSVPEDGGSPSARPFTPASLGARALPGGNGHPRARVIPPPSLTTTIPVIGCCACNVKASSLIGVGKQSLLRTGAQADWRRRFCDVSPFPPSSFCDVSPLNRSSVADPQLIIPPPPPHCLSYI